jgi:L-fuconolactonase
MLDAHAHLWDLTVRDQAWIPGGSPIRRSFSLADLRTALTGTPVHRVLLVQVTNDAGETADFLRIAAGEDLVAGVIGWADLTDPSFESALDQMRAAGPLVGIRHQALAEVDPAGWLRHPSVLRNLGRLAAAGLPFDLMIRPEHFGAAREIAREHPSLQLVLDHLGKPPIADGRLEPWASGLRTLAAEPNVACKLSGVHTIAHPDSTYTDLALFVEVALDSFGPQRIVFGSDWPVCTSAASYSQVVDTVQWATGALPTEERAAVLGGNARRIYLGALVSCG